MPIISAHGRSRLKILWASAFPRSGVDLVRRFASTHSLERAPMF